MAKSTLKVLKGMMESFVIKNRINKLRVRLTPLDNIKLFYHYQIKEAKTGILVECGFINGNDYVRVLSLVNKRIHHLRLWHPDYKYK